MEETSVVTDVQDSSPSPAVPTETIDLTKYTKAERQSWRETGKLPEKEPPKEEIKETSDAETEKEEAESSPVSETETNQGSKPPKRHDAKDRIQQLLAENKRLKSENESLRVPRQEVKETPKAESSPAKPAETKRPVRPKLEDFDTIEAHEAAMDKYEEDLADYKADQKIREYEGRQQREAALRETANQLKEASTKYPDFTEVAKPVVEAFASPEIHPDFIKALNATEGITDLLYAIGKDQALVDKLVNLAKTNPIEAARKLGQLEAIVADEKKAQPKEVEKKAPETPVTRAPKPISEVGGKGTATEDPAVAAAKANDVRSVFREWNRKASGGK